jgi:hypothetical protein
MNKLIAIFLFIVAAIFHLLMGAPRVEANSSSVTSTVRGRSGIATCDDLDITYDGERAVRAEETIALSGADARDLSVKAPSASGIMVQGWDRDDASITACKAAPDRRKLDAISVSHDGGQVLLSGPRGEEWTVYLIVRAPKDAALDLETENGPVELRDLSGTVKARTQNGPLSVRGCAGDITASTQNGPIDFSGGGRRVDLRAQNGPLTVTLGGTSWDGGSLTATTKNGPLDLVLPEGFESGVEVEASEHSPFTCKARACAGAERTWDDDARQVHFGGGPTIIHLSTVNGPVSIGSSDQEI